YLKLSLAKSSRDVNTSPNLMSYWLLLSGLGCPEVRASIASSSITFPFELGGRGALAVTQRARVQRRPSNAARSASTEHTCPLPSVTAPSVGGRAPSSSWTYWGPARLSFTAGIARPPLYRGGSASTKDGLATPQSLLLLTLRPSYNIFLKLTPWHSDGFRVPV